MNCKRIGQILGYYKNVLIFIIVPIILLPVPIIQGGEAGQGAYVLLLMSLYWATECIPLPVTAFLPIILYPTIGIMTSDEVAINYLNETGILTSGAFIVAISLEQSNVNKRIALAVLASVGHSKKWLMFGFMLPSWVLSMFINNITVVAIMMPILEQVLKELDDIRHNQKPQGENLTSGNTQTDSTPVSDQRIKQVDISLIDNVPTEETNQREEQREERYISLVKALSLSIPYATNAGGIATMTGTTPGLIIKSYVDDLWSENGEESPLNYSDWIIWGLPQAVINFALYWVYLQIYFLGWRFFFNREKDIPTGIEHAHQIVLREYKKLGAIRVEEVLAGGYFILLVLLWLFRDPGFMSGWVSLFEFETGVGISVPTMAIVMLLFITPSSYPTASSGTSESQPIKFLLNFKQVKPKFNWGIIFLIGGGFALADGSEKSGLSGWIGDQLRFVDELHPVLTITLYTASVTICTQLISNNATTLLLLPISESVALAMDKSPLFLMLPLASGVQLAFILPVANPAMSITYSYGRIKMQEWVRCGIGITILTILPIVACFFTYGRIYFDLNTIPWEETAYNISTISPYR